MASADAAAQTPGTCPRPVLVTLTYRRSASWEASHVASYVNRVRKEVTRAGHPQPRYQWVLELTQAGKPHYHVLWWLPRSVRLRKADQARHWTQGSTRTERARRGPAYLSKYVSKGIGSCVTHRPPRGARLFGVGGTPDASHRARLPAWLRPCLATPQDRIRRIPRLGFASILTGEFWHPRFRLRLTRTDSRECVIEVHTIDEEPTCNCAS